jgi:hypothetical protein
VIEPQIINTYRFTHQNDHTRNLGDIDARIIILALGNFEKDEQSLETRQEKWLYAFKDELLSTGTSKIEPYKHIGNIDNVIDPDDRGLQRFYQLLNKQNSKESDLQRYEESIRNSNVILQDAEEKGKSKRNREIVVNMIKADFDNASILQVTSITQQDLDDIKQSIVAMES